MSTTAPSTLEEPDLRRFREILENTGAKILVIEAYWDGDPDGWFVELVGIVDRPSLMHHRYAEEPLAWFRGPAGDMRLFNQPVPAWPEMAQAHRLGARLAADLGVPFHAPEQDSPTDDFPRWWALGASPQDPLTFQVEWTVEIHDADGRRRSRQGATSIEARTPQEAFNQAYKVAENHERSEGELGRIVRAGTVIDGFRLTSRGEHHVYRVLCAPAVAPLLRSIAFDAKPAAAVLREIMEVHAVNRHDLSLVVYDAYESGSASLWVTRWAHGEVSDEALQEALKPLLVPSRWKG